MKISKKGRKRPLEAAVFDLDGMLLNTQEYLLAGYEHALTLHGHVVPERAFMLRDISKSLRECFQLFAPGGDIEKLRDTHREFQMQRLDLIVPYDGLDDMLRQLKGSGLKLAICTNRGGESAITSLHHSGIAPYFDTVVCGDEVAPDYKPHPKGLLKVLTHLRVSPQSAVMLGDSAADIEAGKAAGVACTIGITHGAGSQESLEQAQPTFLVHSLREIPALLLPMMEP